MVQERQKNGKKQINVGRESEPGSLRKQTNDIFWGKHKKIAENLTYTKHFDSFTLCPNKMGNIFKKHKLRILYLAQLTFK